jgi:hypothetical protein
MKWSWSQDTGHEYEILTRIDIELFLSYFHRLFFNFIIKLWVYWILNIFIFFVLLSITITQPRGLGHTFVMLAQIDSEFLHHFILISNLFFILLIFFCSFSKLIFIYFQPSSLGCWELGFVIFLYGLPCLMTRITCIRC